MSELSEAVEPGTEEVDRPAGPAEHDEPLVQIVAGKVLFAWLRNRQQLLMPYTIDLAKLDAGEVELVVQAMIVAAQADGTVDGKERDRVRSALERLKATPEQLANVDAALDHPQPLAHALSSVKDVQTGAIVYAASLLAIDRRKLVNRQYLRSLSARLQLPKDVCRALEQRFFATVD